MNKFSANKYIDKSWSSLVRNLESQQLSDTIKIIILRKRIAIRARSFVNTWVKRKSANNSLQNVREHVDSAEILYVHNSVFV